MTKDEILAASPEQLRVMVAEARGWTEIERGNDNTSFLWGTAPERGDADCYGTTLLPNWPRNYAVAWELHRSAWKQSPQFLARYLFAMKDILTGKFPGSPSCWMALLEFFDPDTICRAWLLANLEGEK